MIRISGKILRLAAALIVVFGLVTDNQSLWLTTLGVSGVDLVFRRLLKRNSGYW